MAATGYTPIQLYRTTTSGAAPSASNLSPGELGFNINDADMALYAKNNTGTVKRIINNPAGLKYPTADGTSGQVVSTDGSGNLAFVTPTAGASVSAANTWTATQTFNGSSSTFGTVLLDSAETVNVVGSAPSTTTNLYVQSGAVQYYTSNAANNFVVNLAFSSGTTMNSALSTNQSTTATLVTTQGSTAYYATSIQVDGTTSGVTTRWIGGAPTAGNASGLDVYRFAVIKTASATYTVLASLTQFKA
ncbi:MAG: hypothetical protein ACKO0Z_24150 [Betaproteobacteria bacterium]